MTRDRMHWTLSGWHFWVAVAYFGLVLTVVGLYFVNQRAAHEQSVRNAIVRAANSTQVGQCFTSLKNAPVAQGFIDAHEAIIENGLLTNRAAIATSGSNDPLHEVRIKSIHRLEAAQANVAQLRKLIAAGTPTKAKCLHLAHMLHVNPARYLANQ